MQKQKFSISGMTCAACSAGIQKTINKLNGIKKADVSLMGESMVVEFDESVVSTKEIISAVQALGYGARIYGDNDNRVTKVQTPSVQSHAKSLKVRFLLSLLFLIPLMYFTMAHMLVKAPLPPFAKSPVNFALIQILLTTPIIFINFAFFKSGVSAIIKKVPNMDTLVSLGATASYLYSIVVTFIIGNLTYNSELVKAHELAMDGLFFESAAMILTLVTLGKWLEARSKRKTGEEIEKLLKLAPDSVTIEIDGIQKNISISQLKKGDIVVVKQGDGIPVDGFVIFGSTFVDKSAITGESLPVEIQEGDFVTSASVNKGNLIKIKAEKVGEETMLAKIINLVKSAGESKAPIEKFVDKIAGVFVPIVLVISLITLIIWLIVGAVGGNVQVSRALNMAISVLVISCPCALGLATPVAVMAATGRGASLGVLYKDAEILQKARSINTILLDKTATITEGKPKVVDIKIYSDFTLNQILSLVASVEQNSNHPLAECIVEYAKENGATLSLVDNFKYFSGKGGVGFIGDNIYCIGNEKLMVENFVEISFAENDAKNLSENGTTVLFFSENKKLIALIGVADTLKENSKEAINLIKTSNITPIMLTGDAKSAANSIARQVGIERVYCEVLPEDKLNAVIKNQKNGVVAMVGDGINDSPALKQADIGMAMGNGTDIAIDSADIILVNGDLRAVDGAIELSKATVRNIKENLFWAFIYNVLGIPIAAGALYAINVVLNPMLGALAMSLSSLFVVTNALRLTAFKPKYLKKKKIKEVNNMKKILVIDGMSCPHCSARVEKALNSIEGVSATVNLKKKIAEVETEVDVQVLIKAIEDAGYSVKKVK